MIYDLNQLTFTELYALYCKVGWEIFTRIWWLPVGMIVVGLCLTWFGNKKRKIYEK